MGDQKQVVYSGGGGRSCSWELAVAWLEAGYVRKGVGEELRGRAATESPQSGLARQRSQERAW